MCSVNSSIQIKRQFTCKSKLLVGVVKLSSPSRLPINTVHTEWSTWLVLFIFMYMRHKRAFFPGVVLLRCQCSSQTICIYLLHGLNVVKVL